MVSIEIVTQDGKGNANALRATYETDNGGAGIAPDVAISTVQKFRAAFGQNAKVNLAVAQIAQMPKV